MSSARLSVPFSSGQWLLHTTPAKEATSPDKLSVPFSSGQWLLQGVKQWVVLSDATFSPLFIGAMVATSSQEFTDLLRVGFQSPFHRGNGCYIPVAVL